MKQQLSDPGSEGELATGSPEDNELHGQEEGVFQACEDGIRDSRTESGGASAAWAKCAAVVKSHSDEMVKRWKDEIDTLLVYAGLFSGVVTTFNVQSYALLQPSSSDASLAVLTQISDQLKSFSLSPPFVNSTSIPSPVSSSFRAPRSAVWINALWFSSLICSLSAASIGIMVKQWLHEAELGLAGSSREAARVRQYRYDGLRKWQVGTIVATLPVLLQLAATLFFAGLLVLLWTLHPVVAAVASGLVGTLFFFTIVTIILPALVSDCTYHSPQALGIFLMSQAMGRLLRPVLTRASHLLEDRGAWISALHDTILGVAQSDWGSFRGWAGRERVETTFAQNDLDENILKVADAVPLDNRFLEVCVRPCVSTLPSWSAVRCFKKIHASRIHHLGPLWGRYGSLGHRYEAQVELTLDVVERCLDDPVRLYAVDDLKSIVKGLLLRLQYPLSEEVGKRVGHVVAGVVVLGGDIPHMVVDALRSRECLADECYLDVSVREVVDALHECVSESSPDRQPTMACAFADAVASIALHPHLWRGQHRDYVKDRLEHALGLLQQVLGSQGGESHVDARGFSTAAIRLLETLQALEQNIQEPWSHDMLAQVHAALANSAFREWYTDDLSCRLQDILRRRSGLVKSDIGHGINIPALDTCAAATV